MPVRVYLDTCICGMVFDEPCDAGADETAEAIGELCDSSAVEFVTSTKTLKEILKTGDPRKRNLLKLYYRIMEKLPERNLVNFVPALVGSFMLGQATLGGGFSKEDPLFTSLKAIFDHDDAEHVFQATKGGCQFFLTLDQKTILKRARRSEADLQRLAPGLRLVHPVELIGIFKQSPQSPGDGDSNDSESGTTLNKRKGAGASHASP